MHIDIFILHSFSICQIPALVSQLSTRMGENVNMIGSPHFKFAYNDFWGSICCMIDIQIFGWLGGYWSWSNTSNIVISVLTQKRQCPIFWNVCGALPLFWWLESQLEATLYLNTLLTIPRTTETNIYIHRYTPYNKTFNAYKQT